MIDDAVIQPGRSPARKAPATGIMVAHPADMATVCRTVLVSEQKPEKLMMSRVHIGSSVSGEAGLDEEIGIVGPFIGAPYAVMLLETLIAWGMERVIFFGWCGAISPAVKVGDIVIPTAAFCEDGTSPHYQDAGEQTSRPSETLCRHLSDICLENDLSIHEGPVWTTDAVFRETPDLITAFQRKKALAVEMEAAALFSVGRFRGISIAAILAVSDALSTLKWEPGFSNRQFIRMREIIPRLIADVVHRLKGNGS